ncbi:MAG: hypothetical protein JST48_09130 [Bacteroidetes bacterium]|nr:hypothetical protein [Bacteroidota bacterium]
MKFKELFPLMATMGPEELRNSLKEFLAVEMDHPNANFRMALVYEENYKHTDPLTHYEYVMANADQAKLRYIKAKLLVNEHEVNKNNLYYFPIFKITDAKGQPNVPFAIVSAKIKNGYDSAELFIKKLPPIYIAFTKSVNFYDQAVKIFAGINSRFLSLNDLYLYYNNDLDTQLETLRLAYDSAKYSFDKYLALTKDYPLLRHHQHYEVNPIVTYRLDGLTTSLNFLTDRVFFWDYQTWVAQVRKSVQGPIAALRKDLEQAEERLDQSLSKINGATQEIGLTPIKLDKQLIFNLNNYDKQSLVLALLDYKTFEQHWKLQEKLFTPDTTFSDRNADQLSSLIYACRNADTLANIIRERITDAKIGKHSGFFTKYYGSKDDLSSYYLTKESEIDKLFKNYTARLQAEIKGYIQPAIISKSDNKFLRFGKWNVPLQVTEPTKDQIDQGALITLLNKKNADGSIYLSGIYKSNKKLSYSASFLAKVNPDGKPGWIKNFDFKVDTLSKIPDASNYVTTLELTREGCAVVVHTVDTVKQFAANTLVYFSDRGEEKFKARLKEENYPRRLIYIETTNSFILVLKGADKKNNYSQLEPIVVMGINTLGDVIWRRIIEVAGSFNEMVNLNDGNLLVGNFMILKTEGKEFRTQVSKMESNPFVVLFNSQGDIVKAQPVQSTNSTLVVKTVKVNDMSINLLGVEGTFDQEVKPMNVEGMNVHIMMNKFGQKIF